jgi:hypothetical protein
MRDDRSRREAQLSGAGAAMENCAISQDDSLAASGPAQAEECNHSFPETLSCSCTAILPIMCNDCQSIKPAQQPNENQLQFPAICSLWACIWPLSALLLIYRIHTWWPSMRVLHSDLVAL